MACTIKIFLCNVGVRQGENLSPSLFALYLNDFDEFMFCNNGQRSFSFI